MPEFDFALAISIHAPRTGSDTLGNRQLFFYYRFQSTLPARGATFRLNQYRQVLPYFNPRSPHGERRISPHCINSESTFQSTLPARGATAFPILPALFIPISIHAPRTGSDMKQRPTLAVFLISIHAPRTGSDPPKFHCPQFPCKFQSTLPARGATRGGFLRRCLVTISIHAPRTGSDSPRRARGWPAFHFNPRSPHGERQRLPCKTARFLCISIHAPRTGSDVTSGLVRADLVISIHAPRTGSDRAK